MKPIKTKSGLETITKKGCEQLLKVANKISRKLIDENLTNPSIFSTKVFYPLSKTVSKEYNQEIWDMLPPETPLCQTIYQTYTEVRKILIEYLELLKRLN